MLKGVLKMGFKFTRLINLVNMKTLGTYNLYIHCSIMIFKTYD